MSVTENAIFKPLLFRPSPITIHDNGNVRRQII
jgi:hypothetical protein